MQVYEFQCPDCGATRTEVSAKHPADISPACPECGAMMGLDRDA